MRRPRSPLVAGLVAAAAALLLAGSLLLLLGRRDNADTDRLRERATELNARLYGALRLAQVDLAVTGFGADSVAYATVHPALALCRANDAIGLRRERGYDRGVEPLIAAFEAACQQLDVPLAPGETQLDWRMELSEIVPRLAAALAASNSLPAPPYERLTGSADLTGHLTPADLSRELSLEARGFFYMLCVYAGECPPLGSASFVDTLELQSRSCHLLSNPADFRHHASFSPAEHEPLLTRRAEACQVLRDARSRLGPPRDSPEWREAVREAFVTLASGAPAEWRRGFP